MKFDSARSEAIVLHVCPFNSEKKRGGVAVQLVIGLILVGSLAVDDFQCTLQGVVRQ